MGFVVGMSARSSDGFGPYAQVRFTRFAAQSNGATMGGLDASAAERWADGWPEQTVSGRVGWRRVLFLGDLDADLYLSGTTWSAFGSRAFHRATGLLVVPAAADRRVDASWSVDVVFEGQIRTATVFLSYENALAGTSSLAGNQLVPLYPLAEQRFRIGVYWPIPN